MDEKEKLAAELARAAKMRQVVDDAMIKNMVDDDAFESGRGKVTFKRRDGSLDRDATITNLARNKSEDFLQKLDKDFPENRPLSFKNKLKRGMVEGYAEGGMVKKTKAKPVMKMAKGGMMCSPRKKMAMGMKSGGMVKGCKRSGVK